MWEGGENLGAGSFQWHLTSHQEDNCLLYGKLVLQDALPCPQILALKHIVITDCLICPDADYIGKLLTDEDFSLTLEWRCKENKSEETVWREQKLLPHHYSLG